MNLNKPDTGDKLAIFLPCLAGGGAERSMLTVATEIARRGIKVDLVLAVAKGQLLEQASVIPGVKIVNLKSSRVLKSILPLIRYIRQENPRSVLSALEHANLAAMMAVGIGGLSNPVKPRLIISIHGLSPPRGLLSSLKSIFQNYLTRVFLRQAKVIIAVSRGMAEYYSKKFNLTDNSRPLVIHNPVLRPEIYRLAQEEAAHPWLQHKTKPVVIAAGRLVGIKNFQSLIQAFRLVKAEIDCNLIILGEGSERAFLESQVTSLGLSDSVSLPGFKLNPYAYFKNSDLFVSCSEYESFGMALVEAMALGTPVLSVDSLGEGPSEILERGRWGKLIPPGDIEALSSGIVESLTSGTRNQSLLRARDFSSDKIIDRYLEVLNFKIFEKC